MADRTPYLGKQAKQTGRTPYLGPQKANTQRTPYLGGASKSQAAPKKHGDGFLGTLAHIVTQTPKDLANAAYHAPGGVYHLGESAVKDTAAFAQNLPARIGSTGHGKPEGQKKTGRTSADVKGIAKQTLKTVEHPLRHPGDTALIFAPAIGQVAKIGEAGALARAGASARTVAKAATVGVKPGPRVLKVGGMEVRGHYSKAAGSRVVQKATDRALEKGAAKSVRVENQLHRRAAKWETRNQRTADAVARAPGTRVAALGAKLKPAELRALRLVAEETPVERRLGAQEMRKARATHPKEHARHQERIDVTRGAMEHLTSDAQGRPVFKPEATKLKAVYKAIQVASKDRETILKHLDLMDEAALQAAKEKVAFVAAGGNAKDFVPKRATEYRMTHSSPDAESGAPLHDLTGKGRIYPDDIYDTKTQSRFYGHGDRSIDAPMFSVINKARGNPDAVVTIYRGVPKDVKKIQPGDWVTPNKAYAVGHAASEGDGKWHVISRDVPAREVFTNGDSVHEYGWHPSGANVDISQNAVHIGNPVDRTKLRGKPKVSSTGTIGHTQKPSSLKVSTGGSVEHALERGDVTNIVAERHAEAVRLGKIDRLVQRFTAAGDHTPRRKDDVWMWTDKVVSNEKIPKEVREYLDNPEAIASLTPDAKGTLYDKIRDATFEKHDWQDAEKVAEFQKLAKDGKGVFVPRRLLGEFTKRSYHIGDNAGIKFVDAVNNAQKAGLVYLKLNYPLIQGVSNTAMNMIQGAFHPHRISEAVKAYHGDAETTAVVEDIMGQGAITQAAFEGQGAIARGTQKLAHTMSHKVDTPARLLAFYHEAAKLGYKGNDGLRRLIFDEKNVGDLYEVAQKGREAIVDYGDMGPVERNIIRRIVFVYPWQKGAVKYAGHFLRDHPVQAAALSQLGELGKKRSDETFGPVPSYLTGLMPVGGKAVNPAGVNFFQTPVQIGTAVSGIATGNPAQRSAGLGFLAPAPGVLAGLLSGSDNIGRPLKGNPLAKVRDLTVAQTALAGVARTALPDSPVVNALIGSKGPSKTFPGKNDPYWRFGLGGLYPRRYSKGALNQNAAREKTRR